MEEHLQAGANMEREEEVISGIEDAASFIQTFFLRVHSDFQSQAEYISSMGSVARLHSWASIKNSTVCKSNNGRLAKNLGIDSKTEY